MEALEERKPLVEMILRCLGLVTRYPRDSDPLPRQGKRQGGRMLVLSRSCGGIQFAPLWINWFGTAKGQVRGSFREELNEAGVVCPEERSEEIIRLFTREDLQNHEKNTAAGTEGLGGAQTSSRREDKVDGALK